jgi:hypothetical protein
MRTFYHVSGEPLASGLTLEPGRFGHTVRRTNSHGGVPLQGSNAMVLIWETALETARQLLAPSAPSRSKCVFATATLSDARAFRDRFHPGAHIYEVRIVVAAMCRTLDPGSADAQIWPVLKRTAFIVPSAPVLKRAPPSGPEWLHEVKHDGWRAQLPRHDAGGAILSITARF